MASGTGKTFVAYQIIENFCLNSDQQVMQVCFFAPSLTLLNQTASNFIQ